MRYTFVIALLLLVSCGGAVQTKPATFQPGEEKFLYTGTPDDILVAKTETAFERLVELSIAKDVDGISRMVVLGEALLVQQYTAVKVINSRPTKTEVRITSGKFNGQNGWVPNEFIR